MTFSNRINLVYLAEAAAKNFFSYISKLYSFRISEKHKKIYMSFMDTRTNMPIIISASFFPSDKTSFEVFDLNIENRKKNEL